MKPTRRRSRPASASRPSFFSSRFLSSHASRMCPLSIQQESRTAGFKETNRIISRYRGKQTHKSFLPNSPTTLTFLCLSPCNHHDTFNVCLNNAAFHVGTGHSPALFLVSLAISAFPSIYFLERSLAFDEFLLALERTSHCAALVLFATLLVYIGAQTFFFLYYFLSRLCVLIFWAFGSIGERGKPSFSCYFLSASLRAGRYHHFVTTFARAHKDDADIVCAASRTSRPRAPSCPVSSHRRETAANYWRQWLSWLCRQRVVSCIFPSWFPLSRSMSLGAVSHS